MSSKRVAAATLAVMIAAGCGGEQQADQALAQAMNGNAGHAGVGHAADAAAHAYAITIENLTYGQPLSPGIVATHTKSFHLFQLGHPASEGIRIIAEEGDPSVAAVMLSSGTNGFVAGVNDAPTTTAPVHRKTGPGSNRLSLLIEARANANRLSLALMLICTNDGFVGLDSVKLPGGFKPKVYWANGYDAGTEQNNELSPQLADPCGAIGPVTLPADGNGRVATSGVIMPHPGIQGGGDLSVSAHGWNDPAAKITVQRID